MTCTTCMPRIDPLAGPAHLEGSAGPVESQQSTGPAAAPTAAAAAPAAESSVSPEAQGEGAEQAEALEALSPFAAAPPVEEAAAAAGAAAAAAGATAAAAGRASPSRPHRPPHPGGRLAPQSSAERFRLPPSREESLLLALNSPQQSQVFAPADGMLEALLRELRVAAALEVRDGVRALGGAWCLGVCGRERTELLLEAGWGQRAGAESGAPVGWLTGSSIAQRARRAEALAPKPGRCCCANPSRTLPFFAVPPKFCSLMLRRPLPEALRQGLLIHACVLTCVLSCAVRGLPGRREQHLPQPARGGPGRGGGGGRQAPARAGPPAGADGHQLGAGRGPALCHAGAQGDFSGVGGGRGRPPQVCVAAVGVGWSWAGGDRSRGTASGLHAFSGGSCVQKLQLSWAAMLRVEGLV